MNPTIEQLDFIEEIENVTKHIFKGNTKEEAENFINNHIEEYKFLIKD